MSITLSPPISPFPVIPPLGKTPYVHDDRSLLFEQYTTGLQAPPTDVDWGAKVRNWPVFLNDKIGDCTIAAIAHMIEGWSANAGIELPVTWQECLAAYSAISGYNPTTGQNDNGAAILQVLQYFQSIGLAHTKIKAYAEINIQDTTSMRQAIDLLGAVDIGLQLPIACQSMGTTWTIPPELTGAWAPGSWGGHSICLLGFTPAIWIGISWGEVITIDAAFLAAYMDEAWAAFSTAWLEKDGLAPSGFNTVKLLADLALLAQAKSVRRPVVSRGLKTGC
jgi:hypothetical protein